MINSAHQSGGYANHDDAVMRRWSRRASGASIVDPVRLRRPDAHVAAYSENRWPLDALGDECKDAIVFQHIEQRQKAIAMGWRDIEQQWREPLKRVAWLLINKPTPEHLLTLPGQRYTSRPGSGTIGFTVTKIARFLQWLADLSDAGPRSIHEIDSYHLEQWVKHVHGMNIAQPSSYTRPLTYLWAWGETGELPTADVLVRPFWVGKEKSVLSRHIDLGEGRAPLSEQTIDPLIWWAVEFVERFSHDCLAALHWYHEIRDRIDLSSRSGHDPQAAAAWLRSLPVHPSKSGKHEQRDMVYLTAISPGFPRRSIWSALDKLRRSGHELPPIADSDAPKPVPVQVAAQINDRSWLQLDWSHVVDVDNKSRASPLWTALQGACAVVIGYLGAGPRPLELRSLTRACLKIHELEGGALRYLIGGRIRKGHRDESDQVSLDGVDHLWPVLPQAARAVEVLENLPNPLRSNYLFSDPTGVALDGAQLNKSMQAFVHFANELARQHRLPAIADADDGISAGRLRRTIGPFIRNRPDGAFGLAVVYGHTGSIIGATYGGMKQSGSGQFLRRETADHIAITLNNINTSLAGGGGISGPAAHQALDAATTFRGAILTSRDWKKILANPDIQTYDNPDRAVGCRFDPNSSPPCQNDTVQNARTEPDLTNCHKDCFNRFYTDEHALAHEDKAREYEAWAELAPEPEAIRLRRGAAGHRATAEQHWVSRIGIDGTPLRQRAAGRPENDHLDPPCRRSTDD